MPLSIAIALSDFDDAALPHLLEFQRPLTVLGNYLETKTMPAARLKTYGMLITPITLTDTGQVVGYVTYWENRHVTISKVDGNNVLLIDDFWRPTSPNPDECLSLWDAAIQ